MKKILIAIILCATVPTLLNSSASATQLANFIYISGDNSLKVGINGISSGNGTQQNPFLIQNYIIALPNNPSNGIYIINTDKFIKINNVEIIGVQNGMTILNSSHIIINNVAIKNPTHSGIILFGSHDIMITNSTFTDVPERAIYTNTDIHPENNNRISLVGNTIENTGQEGIVLLGNNTLIAKNRIIDPGLSAIVMVSPFSNSFIIDNYIEGTEQDAIYVFGYKYTIFVPPVGQFPQDSTNLYVINNELKNIHNDGIEFAMGTTNSVMMGNYIHDSPLADGVIPGQMNSLDLWESSNNNLILNNIVANMGGDIIGNANGAVITDSSNNIVEHNSITNAGLYGLFLFADFGAITGNVFSNNCIFSEAVPYGYLNLVDSQNLTLTNSVNLNSC